MSSAEVQTSHYSEYHMLSSSKNCCGQLDLNQRPLAYETSELPDCSTPQYISTKSTCKQRQHLCHSKELFTCLSKCAATPKETNALPFTGCLRTLPGGPCATRSQGSHPIASVSGVLTLPDCTIFTPSMIATVRGKRNLM